MGVWKQHEDSSGGTLFTRAVQDGLSIVGEKNVEYGPLSNEEMRSRVLYSVRNPRFDNEVLRDQHGKGVTR
jgi:hypothetical protein